MFCKHDRFRVKIDTYSQESNIYVLSWVVTTYSLVFLRAAGIAHKRQNDDLEKMSNRTNVHNVRNAPLLPLPGNCRSYAEAPSWDKMY